MFKKKHPQLNTGKTHFKKGHIPWNKGKKGFKHSKETCEKMSQSKKGHPCYNTGRTHFKKGHKVPKEWREKWKNSDYHKNLGGKNNPAWKGGKYKDKAGYIIIHKPKHPFSQIKGYIKRARLVMEKKLGRYLTPKEIVHHINGIIDDDRPENLMLFANHSEHRKHHCLLRKNS